MCLCLLHLKFCFSFFNLKPDSWRGSQSGTTAFLANVVNLCKRSGNNWYRVYLIRKICSQDGVDFVLKLLKKDQMRWIFPDEALQKVKYSSVVFSFGF